MGARQAANPGAAETRREREFDYGRTVALSDGVFAIAMTLLVLSIDVPDVPLSQDGKRLPEELGDLWPQLFSYFLSFGAIGLNWLIHHQVFRAIARFDRRLSVANLVYLAFIALIPFPTQLIGEYSDDPRALVAYAINIAITTGLNTAMYWHAARAGLLRRHEDPDLTRRKTLLGLVPLGTFLVSIPVAFLSTTAAFVLWFLSWPLRNVAARLLGIESLISRRE